MSQLTTNNRTVDSIITRLQSQNTPQTTELAKATHDLFTQAYTLGKEKRLHEEGLRTTEPEIEERNKQKAYDKVRDLIVEHPDLRSMVTPYGHGYAGMVRNTAEFAGEKAAEKEIAERAPKRPIFDRSPKPSERHENRKDNKKHRGGKSGRGIKPVASLEEVTPALASLEMGDAAIGSGVEHLTKPVSAQTPSVG